MFSQQGQLTTNKATLRECTASGGERLDYISYVNESASTVTVNLYHNDGSTSRKIIAKDLALPAGAHGYMERPVFIRKGEKLEGDASANSAVTYVVQGMIIGWTKAAV